MRQDTTFRGFLGGPLSAALLVLALSASAMARVGLRNAMTGGMAGFQTRHIRNERESS
jgi:hypothetical protein